MSRDNGIELLEQMIDDFESRAGRNLLVKAAVEYLRDRDKSGRLTIRDLKNYLLLLDASGVRFIISPITGGELGEFFVQARLRQAKQLLEEDWWTNQDVARRLRAQAYRVTRALKENRFTENSLRGRLGLPPA